MQFARFFSYTALYRPSGRVAVNNARLMCTAAPAKIPMSLIQELRNRTGAGVTDCKKALESNKSDIALATTWLREKGKLTATKLSSRVAGEGVVSLAFQGGNGIIIEMNSETDFVARGISFKTLAHKIVDTSVGASQLMPKDTIDSVAVEFPPLSKLQVEVENDEPGKPPIKIPVEEAITRTITKTKENIKMRRAYGISTDKGVIGGYIHGGEGDTKAGKLGALVSLYSPSLDSSSLSTLATQVAMHIVGLNPKCIDTDSPILTQEITKANENNKGKEKTAAEVTEDVVLLEQKYFMGNGETVREMLTKAGPSIKVLSFSRLAVGEGIEKKETDFAEEVMGMVKS